MSRCTCLVAFVLVLSASPDVAGEEDPPQCVMASSYIDISGIAQGSGSVTVGCVEHEEYSVTVTTAAGETGAQIAAKLAAANGRSHVPDPDSTQSPIGTGLPAMSVDGSRIEVHGTDAGDLFFRTTDAGLDTIGAVSALKATASKEQNKVTLTWTLPTPPPAWIYVSMGRYGDIIPGTSTSFECNVFGEEEGQCPVGDARLTYNVLCAGPYEVGSGPVQHPTRFSDYARVNADNPRWLEDDVFRVKTEVLSAATQQQEYSSALVKHAGTDPVVWSLAGGALPPGLTMAQQGVIAGTPSATGVYQFTVRVQDANGAAATRDLSLTVTEFPLLGPID